MCSWSWFLITDAIREIFSRELEIIDFSCLWSPWGWTQAIAYFGEGRNIKNQLTWRGGDSRYCWSMSGAWTCKQLLGFEATLNRMSSFDAYFYPYQWLTTGVTNTESDVFLGDVKRNGWSLNIVDRRELLTMAKRAVNLFTLSKDLWWEAC